MAVDYKKIGLVNTKEMFARAIKGGWAVPAFNFNNLEQLQAIIQASGVRTAYQDSAALAGVLPDAVLQGRLDRLRPYVPFNGCGLSFARYKIFARLYD